MLTRTTTSLLEALADTGDDQVWWLFDQRYRPVVIGFGRRLGLAAEDAADAAQETLTRFVQAYRAGRYDRERGRLRSWLFGIARNCIAAQRRRPGHAAEVGVSALDEMPDEATMTRLWHNATEQAIIRGALDRLRDAGRTEPHNVEILHQLLRGRSPVQIAEAMELSVEDVYRAKHRCLKRLQTIVVDLQSAYEDDHLVGRSA